MIGKLVPYFEQITSKVVNSKFRIQVINLHKTFPEYGMRLPDSHMVYGAAAIIIQPTARYSHLKISMLKIICLQLEDCLR